MKKSTRLDRLVDDFSIDSTWPIFDQLHRLDRSTTGSIATSAQFLLDSAAYLLLNLHVSMFVIVGQTAGPIGTKIDVHIYLDPRIVLFKLFNV